MANFLAGIGITTLFFCLIHIIEKWQQSNIESKELTQEEAETAEWLEADLTEESDWDWDDNRQHTEQGIK